jgi:hypothetical protein
MGEDITEVNKIALVKRTRRTETSQYPEEKTSTEIPLVVASESGPGQRLMFSKKKLLERSAIEGDSPVFESETSGLE